MADAHIMVANDDPRQMRALTWLLRERGYRVTSVPSRAALDELARVDTDLLLLDFGSAGAEGEQVLARIRSDERWRDVPVLVTSPAPAPELADAAAHALRQGADDYLGRPIRVDELLARIEALARRTSPEEGSTRFVVGDLVLDRLSHKVTRAGEPIMLQPREFRLLEYLMKHAGQVVTRTMLLENVWDYHFDPQTNVIDVHVSRLRSKIDKNFATPLLHTVRGAGYTIRDSAH